MSSNPSTRAGRYEKQSEGFSAFIPAPLPPNPRVKFTTAFQRALSQAERALERLNGSILTLTFPHARSFESMYIRHEAVMSSKIESSPISLQDCLAAEAQISKNSSGPDMQKVLNYITAMNDGFEQIKTVPALASTSLDIHKKLLQNINEAQFTPGEFRTKQNWIGAPGCRVHDAVYVPPPPNLVVPQMRALDHFVANNVGLPPLVKIGLIHAQFESIHPFFNDNGRVSRIIVTLLLHKSELIEAPFLNLPWFFNLHRQEYYDKLLSVRDEGQWEEWLLFFLQAVETVSEYTAATARRILETQEKNRRLINTKLGRLAANGHRVLDRLYDFPFVSVNEVRQLTGTSFASANVLVARMVDCGLLREYTERYRNRRYLLYNYVDLFKEQ